MMNCSAGSQDCGTASNVIASWSAAPDSAGITEAGFAGAAGRGAAMG